MGILDFLTEGKPVEAVPTSSTQQTILPDWYTNYAMDILANQQAVSSNPYATYQGPRVAEFSGLQQQAFDQVPQAAQAYQPYLQNASRSAADVTQQYMNPYTEQVVNRIGQMGARTLNEQLIPAIQDRMTAAGQFGGTRQAELMGRAIRDTMEGISAQQTGALQQGYSQAQTAAQQDLARQSALASQAQQLGLTGVGALQQAGGMQQQQTQQNLDTAYQDFLRQQAYPQQQIQNMVATLGGVKPAVPQAATMEGTQVPGAFSPSLLSQVGQAYATYKGLGG